jgi:hypothetical protein
MGKEWTDEEVSAEIAKAVQIVREDRIDTLIRSRLSAQPPEKNGTENNPPPSGDGNNPANPGKKKGLWWGTESL